MKLTIDGVEIDAQKLVDQGWTPPKAPEPEVTMQQKGCLVEFSDDGYRWMREMLIYVDHDDPSGPYVTEEFNFCYARLIREPLPVAMIPWSGGKCPMSDNTPVLVVFRNGSISAFDYALTVSWDHRNKYSDIIAYLPLDLRMPGVQDE